MIKKISAKFYIYRNLNRGKLFSVKYKGKVVDRLDDFVAYDCETRVSQAGRKRVLENQKRNVHAFVVANSYTEAMGLVKPNTNELKYNPYRSSNFQCNGENVDRADAVLFKDGKAYIIK